MAQPDVETQYICRRLGGRVGIITGRGHGIGNGEIGNMSMPIKPLEAPLGAEISRRAVPCWTSYATMASSRGLSINTGRGWGIY